MKLQRIAFAAAILILLLSAGAYSENKKSERNSSADAVVSAKPFLGRWDLTLKSPDREYPSWLEIRQEDGQLKAQMVSRWGNARPLPKVELSNGHLTFVSPKEEEDRPEDMVFEGRLVGKILSGTVNAPNGTTWKWTGQKAPSLKRSNAAKWGKPIPLLKGKNLTGWNMA